MCPGVQAGSTLEVTVIMAPEENVVVSTLAWSRAGSDPATLHLNVSAWVAAGGDTATVQDGAGQPLASCTRVTMRVRCARRTRVCLTPRAPWLQGC